MQATRKLWTWLAVICALSFAVLGWVGTEIYLTAPPIPKQVISTKGTVLFSEGQVQRGQKAWLSAGGQQLGSVWGHGSYLAPDWSADWLHREALALRGVWAQRDFGKDFEALGVGQQAELNARLKVEMRGNTYDAATGNVTLSPERTEAVQQVVTHYTDLFGDAPSLDKLREQYAMSSGLLPDADDLNALPAFIFWSAWSAATDRPNETGLSYTSNWPHEPLVDNTPTASAGMWSIASIIFMIAAIVFLRGDRADHGAGGHGRYHRPLCRRRSELLRLPAGPDFAVHREPHHSHAICRAVDCHRLAGHRPVHCASHFRPRAQVPEARR